MIPLNPTAGFDGGPARADAVKRFCETLKNKYGVSATVRMRRGIEIDAGCGQLATELMGNQDPDDDRDVEADTEHSSEGSSPSLTSSSSGDDGESIPRETSVEPSATL